MEIDFRAWFEESPEALVALDAEGRVAAWNAAARNFPGALPEGLGHPWREALPPALHGAVEAALAPGSGTGGATARPRAEGGSWVSLRPVAGEDDWMEQVPAAVFVARDGACGTVAMSRLGAELLRRVPGTDAVEPGAAPVRFFRRGIEIAERDLPLQVAAARNMAVSGAEFDIHFGDGATRRVFGNAHPLRDGEGRVRGAVGVFLDLTARLRGERQALRDTERLDERVRLRTAELQAANMELESFCYSISHDLRTPLRTVAGMAELLRSGASSEAERDDYLRRLERAAGRMDALIRGLLAYSHEGNPAWKEAPVEGEIDLGELAAAVMEDLRFENQRRGAEMVNEIAPGQGWTVRGHAVALQQALVNLLENAVKFVPPGATPRVRLFAERGEGTIRLGVADNGIGVPDEYRGKIFGLFERLHGHDEYGGTGVGLSIARRAVERMGGRIGCAAATPPPGPGDGGPGSLFWIELPAPPR